ncbi:MAG: long-chain fatty acid--CoA ligase [Gemmatimonadetes bacterium]|nr:long-chain fatty acid--CoA ligase [Gemmatimonadota bacterium]
MATSVAQSTGASASGATMPRTTGGPRPTAPGTVNQLFFQAIERYQKPDAVLSKVAGRWTPISHATIAERVRRVALGLRKLGLAKGDRVAILSENRPEWLIADYGCLTAGFTDVPVYPTLPSEQVPDVVADAGAVAIFVSTAAQAAKVEAARAQMPTLRHVITFEPQLTHGATLTLADLEAMGRAEESPATIAAYEADARAVQPGDLATLIYTSGTTGKPKGAMLTHDNFYSNATASSRAVEVGPTDLALSFLPLSHVFERQGDYMLFSMGCSIAYAESVDAVPLNLSEVKPTIMMSVPRLYEKLYARILDSAISAGGLKKQIFFWARGVADRWADEKLAGREPGGFLAWQYGLAQKLVFSKLKQRVGGRLRYFCSGGAPLAAEINKFFYAAGLTILEGYGLTETSPVISVNTPAAFRIGTVGKVIPGVEIMIAADGEILARGPNIMRGYYNRPDATAEAIDADGWFHTGDIGVLEDGYLRITDRKKDIIVTANGKNIAPQPIENLVKTNKYVSQAVMIGDKRKFPIILVVPNWEQLEKWAKIKNILWTDRKELMVMPTVQAKMDKEVARNLGGLAHFEVPQKVVLLEHDFSVDSGELTPTLKVKRRVVDKNYKALIDQVYEAAAAAGHGG